MHELSEQTRRLIDWSCLMVTAASAGVRAMTLSDVALMVTVVAGLLSIGWQLLRFYDRFKYGRPAN